MGLGIQQVLGKAAHATILQREVVKEAGRGSGKQLLRSPRGDPGISPSSSHKEIREGGQNTAPAPPSPRSLAPWAGLQSLHRPALMNERHRLSVFCLC